MKIRPFYELAWKNSKDRENYEKQGNFDTVTPFNIWGIDQQTGKATEIIKNSDIHVVMVETKETNPNFYILTIEFMDNNKKTTMKTQLEEKQLLSLGFTKL